MLINTSNHKQIRKYNYIPEMSLKTSLPRFFKSIIQHELYNQIARIMQRVQEYSENSLYKKERVRLTNCYHTIGFCKFFQDVH